MSPWRRAVRLAVAVALLSIVYFTVPLTREIGRGEVAQILGSVRALARLGFRVGWEVRQQRVGRGDVGRRPLRWLQTQIQIAEGQRRQRRRKRDAGQHHAPAHAR